MFPFGRAGVEDLFCESRFRAHCDTPFGLLARCELPRNFSKVCFLGFVYSQLRTFENLFSARLQARCLFQFSKVCSLGFYIVDCVASRFSRIFILQAMTLGINFVLYGGVSQKSDYFELHCFTKVQLSHGSARYFLKYILFRILILQDMTLGVYF